ncbi:MAG: TonB-dependent receptor [Cyclobacteriaceae bacterium]|jgi:TonB-dependent receptor|nr:TonB-dependent receptor [Cyclobacteriaceae bacterium]
MIKNVQFENRKKSWKPIRLWLPLFLLSLTLPFVSGATKAHSQNLFDVPIAVKAGDFSVEQLFNLIETQTKFTLVYSNETLNVNQIIAFDGNEKSLGTVLQKFTQATRAEVRRINNQLVVKVISDKKNKEEGFGILSGIITDKQVGDRLPGASVRVQNSTIGTVSDLNGEFSLRVPAGEVTIEVSYIGFANFTGQYTITANATSRIEISLNSDVKELENIVITGSLQGQQKALNQQKSADNIKNIVSADQIGRFPDPNVAEALQRVPAVNIERDQGEGRYVLVRGLAPQFTNISINGEQIPSPEAGVRFVALDAVPADQLASIEVSKSLTPDMDGDAIGGSVNLITRTATTENLSINGSALLGYNQIVGRPNFQGSLELGKRFLNNKLGVMINGSYYESDRGSDNWERDGDELELRDYELVRTRTGLSSTLDYKLNSNNEFYFRSLYNRFTDREQRRRYILVPNVDGSPFEDNEIERFTKDRLEKQIVSSFNLGGKHTFNKLNVDYEVAYSEGIQDTPFDIEIGSVAAFDELEIDFETNRNFPSFTVNGVSHLNPENDYLQNSNYEFDELVSGNTYAFDANKTAKVNFTYTLPATKTNAILKWGAKVRLKEKRYDITENVYGWEGGDVTFTGFDAGDYTLDKFEGGPSGKFLDGKYLIRANADVQKVIDHFNANKNGYQLDTEEKQATEAVEAFNATEDVYAAYAMGKWQFKKLMLLGGFRFERTTVSYTSNQVFFDFEGDLDEVVPVAGGTDYNFLLPQVHMKYSVSSDLNIRAAVTRTYARPNFQDIIPSQEIDLNSREGTIGNAALKPVGATNIDVLVEKYFGTVGILSGGVFVKQLNDFIFNQRFSATSYEGRNFGTNVLLTQARNGESANLVGFEIAYQQNLSFLPGALSGLAVYANYTYTHSKAEIQSRNDATELEEIRLPGQARHIGNFSLGYDKGRFNVRISANFNGSYLSELGGDSSEDIFVNDRVQVDATATYTISNKFRFFVEGLNLTNQPFEVYQGSKEQFIQREFYSWWTRVGIKFDL